LNRVTARTAVGCMRTMRLSLSPLVLLLCSASECWPVACACASTLHHTTPIAARGPRRAAVQACVADHDHLDLSLPKGADEHSLKCRFKELARILHPDVSAVPGAERKFQALSLEYAQLRDHAIAQRRLEDASFNVVGITLGVSIFTSMQPLVPAIAAATVMASNFVGDMPSTLEQRAAQMAAGARAAVEEERRALEAEVEATAAAEAAARLMSMTCTLAGLFSARALAETEHAVRLRGSVDATTSDVLAAKQLWDKHDSKLRTILRWTMWWRREVMQTSKWQAMQAVLRAEARRLFAVQCLAAAIAGSERWHVRAIEVAAHARAATLSAQQLAESARIASSTARAASAAVARAQREAVVAEQTAADCRNVVSTFEDLGEAVGSAMGSAVGALFESFSRRASASRVAWVLGPLPA
jgi:hypothetical protein